MPIDEDPGPPHKRRKVNSGGLSGPDGFLQSKSASRVPKIAAPRFQSAFGTSKSTTNSVNGQVIGSPKDAKTSTKSLSRSSISSPHFPVLDPQLHPGSEPGSKPTSKSSRLSHQGSTSTVGTRSTRVEKPISKPSSKPTSKLKPLLPPPFPPAPPKTPLKPLSVPRRPLTDSPARNPPSGRKAMPLQLPLQPPDQPSKVLRTIATTRMARAIDLSTESGLSELASIFLQDHHSEFGLRDEGEPETMRGLDISPKKGSWPGKEPRLQKNGLAAQASEIIAHAKTSLSLWEKEYSIFFSSRSLSARPRADARLCIVKLVHLPRKILSSPSVPGLAVCRLTSSMRSPPFPFETESKMRTPAIFPLDIFSQITDSTPTSPTFFVLFSFNANPSPSSTPIRNPADFMEGSEFCIWKPWRTVNLSPAQVRSMLSKCSDDTNITSGETNDDSAWKPDFGKMEHTVLHCDRFVCARV